VMYVKYAQCKLWLIIMNGDIPIARPKAEWTMDDLNIKGRYTLTCTLSKNKYNKVCRLKITKEVWDSLCINYEGA